MMSIRKKAWNSIRAQRHRCNNPNASDFKYYGGKGVRVEYTTQEFYEWYFKQHKKFKLEDKVSVDRIDHDKNYKLDNIRLVLHSDNAAESNKRRSLRSLYVYTLDTNEFLFKASNLREIATKANIGFTTIYWNHNRGNNFIKKYNIKWEEK